MRHGRLTRVRILRRLRLRHILSQIVILIILIVSLIAEVLSVELAQRFVGGHRRVTLFAVSPLPGVKVGVRLQVFLVTTQGQSTQLQFLIPEVGELAAESALLHGIIDP